MGTTRFNSKIKCLESDGRYVEVAIPDLIQTQLGTGVCAVATGEGDTGSGLRGLIPASTDEIDFLIPCLKNFDPAVTSYVDIYYYTAAPATKGDRIGFTFTYDITSLNSSAAPMNDATTTTGVTNPSSRVIATGHGDGTVYGMARASVTIAPSTFTADTRPHGQVTVGTGASEKELRISEIKFRYSRTYL